MHTAPDAAFRDISEALKFEYWLRFYFIREENGKLLLDVPADRVQRIGETHGWLTGLVDMLNRREVDQESSCSAVCAFLGRAFDGSKYAEGTVGKVLDSKEMNLEQHLFSLWLQGHEELLDSEQMEFSRWTELFEEWKKDEQVRKYAAHKRHAAGLEAPTSESLQ